MTTQDSAKKAATATKRLLILTGSIVLVCLLLFAGLVFFAKQAINSVKPATSESQLTKALHQLPLPAGFTFVGSPHIDTEPAPGASDTFGAQVNVLTIHGSWPQSCTTLATDWTRVLRSHNWPTSLTTNTGYGKLVNANHGNNTYTIELQYDDSPNQQATSASAPSTTRTSTTPSSTTALGTTPPDATCKTPLVLIE